MTIARGKIVGGWFKEESFYRDITTRTLSAGLVALVAYLGAIGLGYVGKPPAQAVFGGAIAAISVALLGFALLAASEGRWTLYMIIAFVAPALDVTSRWWRGWLPESLRQFNLPMKWVWLILGLQCIAMIGIVTVAYRRHTRLQSANSPAPAGSATETPGDSARRPWLTVRVTNKRR